MRESLIKLIRCYVWRSDVCRLRDLFRTDTFGCCCSHAACIGYRLDATAVDLVLWYRRRESETDLLRLVRRSTSKDICLQQGLPVIDRRPLSVPCLDIFGRKVGKDPVLLQDDGFDGVGGLSEIRH